MKNNQVVSAVVLNVKKDFIEDIKDKIPDIDSVLDKVMGERN